MRALLLLALVGCASSDVTGPFTGPTHRYVIDGFTLPANRDQAIAFGDDLDGDGAIDNALGLATVQMTQNDDLTTHARDMIASGAVASTVLVQADDLSQDDAVGVTYLGADGEPATVAGGSIVDGVFTSNPTRTTAVPGSAIVHLPLFADADPSRIEIDGMEVALEPDGAGGYTGYLRGYAPVAPLREQAAKGLRQMIEADPAAHAGLIELIDRDHDGISPDEYAHNLVVDTFLYPDHGDALSVGFGVHLAPCEAGRCAPPVENTCFDRVLEAGEAGVDCGGACRPCPVEVVCTPSATGACIPAAPPTR